MNSTNTFSFPHTVSRTEHWHLLIDLEVNDGGCGPDIQLRVPDQGTSYLGGDTSLEVLTDSFSDFEIEECHLPTEVEIVELHQSIQNFLGMFFTPDSGQIDPP